MRAFALMLGLVVAAAVAPVSAQTTITLRADVWCPYNCEPASDRPGYMVEIAKAAFEARGMRVDYRTLPWTRTLSEVREGRLDGAIGATQGSQESRGLVFGKETLGLSVNVFAVRRGTPPIRSLQDLATRSLVAIADYSYDDAIDAHIAANKARGDRVTLLSGDDVTKRLIRLVIGGRADALVENRYVLAYEMRQVDGSDQLATTTFGEPSALSIGFTGAHPRGAEYAAILDQGVGQLRADGRLAAILQRYGVADWTKTQ